MTKTTDDSPDLWDKAHEIVLATRGSSDVPAFDFCVRQQYQKFKEERDAKN